VKLTHAFSVSPFYRYYTQTGTKHFKPDGEQAADEKKRRNIESIKKKRL
jgi:hypothetical protein